MSKVENIRPDSQDTGDGGGRDGRYINLIERVVKLETHLEHLATKEDIQKLKVWWLGGIVAGMGLAATVALAVVRLFSVP